MDSTGCIRRYKKAVRLPAFCPLSSAKESGMRTRILIAGYGKISTGFGRVVSNLAASLIEKYDVHVLGYDASEDSSIDGWTVHSCSPLDIFGLRRLRSLNDSLRPELILIINDFWFIPTFLAVLKECANKPAIVGYIPVDGRVTDWRIVDRLRDLDGLVVYTEYAQRTLQGAYPPNVNPPPPIANLRIIPHGVSTEVFHPLTQGGVFPAEPVDHVGARRALGRCSEDADGFWVLNANKNSIRKRLDLTMQGFAAFARNKPSSVKLYIHAGRRDTGPDLQRLARNFKLGDRLLLTEDSDSHPSVTLDRLNLIFNACQVGLHTSVGEGWGLVAFEHGATGAAQIVPRHSAFEELWRGKAEFIEPSGSIHFNSILEGSVVSPEGIASALEHLYSDRQRLADLSVAAYSNATRAELSWTQIALLWDCLFRSVLNGRIDQGNPFPSTRQTEFMDRPPVI